MGKRSRKRGDSAAGVTSRAERDAARARRAEALARAQAQGKSATARRRPPGRTSFEDRPPAPWGSFPLVEIVVLIGLVLLVAGFIVRGERGPVMIFGGIVLASLAGLELMIREHFAGFRSHTTVFAAFITLSVMTAVLFATGDRVLLLPVIAIVFPLSFWLFRRMFAKRSGGVGYRR